ncbi:putative ubiquitin-like protein DskB [Tricharina praecox]|uniref:putative ubiquitin-like protein DskB n=1 Tax=Tricharina praecox TaxID=43433 RepID=UPI00222051EB|nr:putative ubiquitin-like protein DskB [Tricharina praecox]KAI5850662.1 putative ubiquitin-like protein DskB [Tricharina praecox]
MSEQSAAAAPETSERPSSPAPDAITFTVKSNNDTKYVLSLPETTTIADVKAKLVELSEVPVERQRLIYSGRVMKNEETLATYKVKSGNTVHMVKGAASNAATSSAGSAGGAPAGSGVPPNLAAGSGNNPLAGLTGARYAGHAQLPSADLFGPDGGMGPPDPEAIAQAMSNPMVQAQMNEMLQNPQLLDYIINSNPMLRAMGPSARELMQSEMFRHMLTDPANIRNMARMGGGPGMGGAGARAGGFPAPGPVDDTPTPTGQQPAGQQPAGQQPAGQQPAGQQPANPFASLFGGPGGAAPPPLSNLFGLQGMPPMFGAPPAGSPGSPAANAGQAGSPPPAGAGQQPQQPFGANPFLNPAAMEQMMQMMGGGANPGGAAAGTGSPAANPFAGLFGGMPPAAAAPPDNTPPEERYADQLRQLNDMGFFDFDRNIEALRRSGGSVQGAVNQLLGG